MSSNKKYKFSTHGPLSKQDQQNNQLFRINKSFNVVSILNNTASYNIQHPTQQAPHHSTGTGCRRSYTNVVNGSIPHALICGGNVNVSILSKCPQSSVKNRSNVLNFNRHGIIKNKTTDLNAHLPNGTFNNTLDSTAAITLNGNIASGGCEGDISIRDPTYSGFNSIGVSNCPPESFYTQKNDIFGNGGCVDKKSELKSNNIVTNNNYNNNHIEVCWVYLKQFLCVFKK